MSRTFYSRYVKGDNIIIEASSSDNQCIESLKKFIDSYKEEDIESSIIDEGRIKTIRIILRKETRLNPESLMQEMMEYAS